MAKLVRSVCTKCGKPTVYKDAKKAHLHLNGQGDCTEQRPAIRMETLIEHF